MDMSKQQLGLFGGAGPQDAAKKVKSKFAGFPEIRFETRDGSIVSFDTTARTCSCGKSDCEHAKTAKDLLDNKGDDFKYTATSALHKEIRRSDLLLATRWARIKAMTYGGYNAKAYAANIVLEETRNAKLMVDFHSLAGKTVRDVLNPMTLSLKKWEIPGKHEDFATYVLSYSRVIRAHLADEDFISADRVTSTVMNATNLGELFDAFWMSKLSDERGDRIACKAAFRDAIRERVKGLGPEIEAAANHQPKFGSCSDFYQGKLVSEMIAGRWDFSHNTIARTPPPSDDEVLYVPFAHNYAFDNHTRRGLIELRRLSEVEPKKPLPGALNIRWSGLLRGVAWRYYAFAQFGDRYRNCAWEDVEIPKDVWASVDEVDGFFYPRLYRGRSDIPLPKR
jgi:hypothetical protein